MSKEEDQIEGFPDFWKLFLLESVTYFSFDNCLVTVFVCALKKQLQTMLLKWKITLSRWLWQSVRGESRNFRSITIPALFESSVEHLITLLGASSRTKAFATVQRFFRAPMESIALYALFGSYSRIFDHNIRHRVSVSLWYVPSQVVGHIRWGLIQSDRVNITKKTFGI